MTPPPPPHGREGDRVSDACDQPASHHDRAAETSTTQCRWQCTVTEQ